MPNFDNEKTKRARRARANRIVPLILAAYQAAVAVRDELAAYDDATDSDLVDAINAAFSSGERTDLSAIGVLLDDMVTTLETDYPDLLAQA